MSNFWVRAISGFFFLIVLVSGIWLHPASCFFLFAIVALGSLWGFYKLEKLSGSNPLIIPGIFVAVLLLGFYGLLFAWPGEKGFRYFFLLLPALFLIPLFELFRNKPNPVRNFTSSLAGLIYCVLPLLFLYRAGFVVDGKDESINFSGFAYRPELILGFFILIWSSDTFAYLTGKAIGRTKLFERISPKKTVEGSLGGIFFNAIAGYLLWHFFGILSLFHWMVLAILVAATGTLGDLIESMLKRNAGVKDSGNIMPGHGGFLDRFDAALFSAPFYMAYLILIH